MKKTLFVTDGAFPPSSGTSIILSNLLKKLPSNRVVLFGEQSYGTDLADWPKPDYPVHLIKHAATYDRKGSRYFIFAQFYKIKEAIIKLIDEQAIESIFAIFPSEVYVFAAAKAAQERRLPFNIWFHNTYRDNRTGLLRLAANYIQPYLFQRADTILTMSEAMKDYFAQHYPHLAHKLKPLLHGFELPEKMEDSPEVQQPAYMLTGSINHSNEDAAIRLCKSLLQMQSATIDVYSSVDPAIFEASGIDTKRMRFIPFLPFDEFEKRFANYHAVLLPHGFGGKLSAAEYQTIFPTRTIPLLYCGRPILAHCPAQTAIGRFLTKYNCAMLVTEKDESAIFKAALSLLDKQELRKQLVANAQRAVHLFNANKQAAEVMNILR